MRLTQLPPRATPDEPAELNATDSLYLRQAILFPASPHPIECIGPALLQEAGAPPLGFWKT